MNLNARWRRPLLMFSMIWPRNMRLARQHELCSRTGFLGFVPNDLILLVNDDAFLCHELHLSKGEETDEVASAKHHLLIIILRQIDRHDSANGLVDFKTATSKFARDTDLDFLSWLNGSRGNMPL